MPLLLILSLLNVVTWNELDPATVVKKMESAYEQVNDYQAQMVVTTLKKGGSSETQRFLYTFKRPKWIRLDFTTPHSGLVIVYPDPDGKAVARLPGLAGFIKLHLSPDHRLLEVSSGQRIDQTNLGLLIRKIGHSLTDQRRGPPEIKEEDQTLRIQVVADNHFRSGVVTLYRFFIDPRQWLPVRVEESTPEGQLERTVLIQNLRTNVGVSDDLFELARGTKSEQR